MTASALKKLTTLHNLREAWRGFWKLSGRQRSSGIDGITPADFHINAERNLARIHSQLQSNYVFSPLRGQPVPKKDGKSLRIICIPTVQDRVVQRLLTAHLTGKADQLGITNDVSFGFIQSKSGIPRGVLAARNRVVELRNQHRWAYKSDISAFFDRIPRDELVNKTVGLLKARSFRSLLLGAASCEIEDVPQINRIASANGIQRGLGVRQGMPLSPLFANIILKDFDAEMIRRGKNLVRYADDFIILADSREECLEVDALARRLLRKIALEIPTLEVGSKTYIASPSQEIEFLGLALAQAPIGGYHLIITDKQREKISRNLNQLKDVNQLIRKKINISSLTDNIERRIGGYKAAYKDAHNIDTLSAILSTARSDILRSVYVAAFGEEKVQALQNNMRQFLNLEP